MKSSLRAHLEPVALPVGTVIFEPEDSARYVHFITSGMVSLTASLNEGTLIEVGLSGPEGFPENLQLLGPALGMRRCFVQLAGTALRMPFKRFEHEFEANPVLRRLVLQLVQSEALVLGQIAACNRLHESDERLARWLLMVADRVQDNQMDLTQDFLAQMLGIRRTSVAVAAKGLQRAGLIEYQRGDIRIIDRKGLEDVACECYGVIRGLYDRLYT